MSRCVEGFEQHEHVQLERRVDELLELGARQHAQDGEHAARAGDAAFEHLVGVDEEILAHGGHVAAARSARAPCARSSSEPSKRLGSVRMETAAAPACAYVRDARADIFVAAGFSRPTAGERSFTSAMRSKLPRASSCGAGGRSAMRARSSRSGMRRLRGRASARGSMPPCCARKSAAHAAPRAPNAASASSVRRAAPLSMASLRDAHALARIVDAADDFERQRRA